MNPPSQPSARPTWAEIDTVALARNYRKLRSLLKPREHGSAGFPAAPRLIPVIKADAYGHGAVEVARTLSSEGAGVFAVALVEEGAGLRDAGITEEIIVLEGAWPGQEEELLRRRLTATVFSAAGVQRLDSAAAAIRSPVPVHVKVDTGMTRLGVPWDDTGPLVRALSEAGRIRVAGTYTHLACADEEDLSFTVEQAARFRHAVASLRASGVYPGELHVSNSAGLLYWKEAAEFSARPGIALYGYPPFPARSPVRLDPVLTLKTRIGRTAVIPPGGSVGYNRRFVATRTTRTATLPVGYADGYPRGFTSSGRVIIQDRWAPVLGAVSMDMIVVDVSDLPMVQEGEEVILLGSSQSCRLDAGDWADVLGTIPYEVLCQIGPRVPRLYLS